MDGANLRSSARPCNEGLTLKVLRSVAEYLLSVKRAVTSSRQWLSFCRVRKYSHSHIYSKSVGFEDIE